MGFQALAERARTKYGWPRPTSGRAENNTIRQTKVKGTGIGGPIYLEITD
jgi:hypothetical protein